MKLPPVPQRAWLLAIVVTALALRIVKLGDADLSTDEIQTLHAIGLPAADLVTERLHAGHVPLYFLLLKAWGALAGTSQFAIRLPSALVGAALVVPAWTFFRRLVGDAAGAWATLLVAIHPLFVELSREARMYPLLALAFIVVADGAAASLDGKPPRALAFVAAGVGPLVHATWGLVAAPLALWMFVELRGAPRDRSAAGRRMLAVVCTSLLVCGALLLAVDPQHQELTRRPWPREAGVFALRLIAGSSFVVRDLFVWTGFAFIWIVAIGLGFAASTPRARRFGVALGCVTPILAVGIGVLGGLPWGPARYVHLAAAGFVPLAAFAVEARWRIRLALCLTSCCISLLVVSTPRTQWSEAAASLRADPSPVVVDDESSRIVLSHYLRRDVFVASPPPGVAVWRHAAQHLDGDEPIVTITER